MNKLHEVEASIRSKRRTAGLDVNGFEVVVALLCIVTGFSYLATEQLPVDLRDGLLARVVFEGVSLAYVGGGMLIVLGLWLRLVSVEKVALLVLIAGLIGHGALLIVMPALTFNPLQMVLIMSVIIACFGRLRILRLIR
jgi:hypothetical protein